MMADNGSDHPQKLFGSDLSYYFFFVLFVVTLGPLLFGYHLAELNAPQSILTCSENQFTPYAYLSPLPTCISMSPLEFGLVSSMFTLGGLVGALSISTLANNKGRLNAMRTTTIAFTIGPIAEACASNVPVMAIGRFISGLGAGAALVVVPIYISEIAPPAMRGFFGSFTQVMTNLGILIANLLGLFLSRGQLWRVILGVGGAIGLNQFGGLAFVIESPKWTAEQGQTSQAKRSLMMIRASDYDVQGEMQSWQSNSPEQTSSEQLATFTQSSGQGHVTNNDADEEARLLDENAAGETQDAAGIRAEFSKRENTTILSALIDPKHRRATIAVMMVMVAQQFTGINSIVMYGVEILKSVLSTSAALLNVFIALLNLVATLSLAPLSDRLGRKACLLYSIAGMGSSSILLGIGILTRTQVLSAIASLMFVGAFALGLGPVPFILASELAHPEAVGATQSWALAANWISTFVVAQFFPVLNTALGPGKVYFIFAAFALAFWLYIGAFVPETKGKQDLDEIWNRTTPRVRTD